MDSLTYFAARLIIRVCQLGKTGKLVLELLRFLINVVRIVFTSNKVNSKFQFGLRIR